MLFRVVFCCVFIAFHRLLLKLSVLYLKSRVFYSIVLFLFNINVFYLSQPKMGWNNQKRTKSNVRLFLSCSFLSICRPPPSVPPHRSASPFQVSLSLFLPSLCLPLYLSIDLSIYLSLSLSFSIYLSICPPIHLSVHPIWLDFLSISCSSEWICSRC